MKRLIQYYDSKKSNKLSLEDLAIYLHHAIPSHIGMFGDDNYAIYTDVESKDALKTLGVEHDCIKYNFQPLDDGCHTLRWLSIMAMMTEPFQIYPLESNCEKRDSENLEVAQLVQVPYNPILAKYGIEQTGGLCGGDILAIPDASITCDAYVNARDIIQEHDITDESEIANIMGSMLYKSAIDKGIVITKYP